MSIIYLLLPLSFKPSPSPYPFCCVMLYSTIWKPWKRCWGETNIWEGRRICLNSCVLSFFWSEQLDFLCLTNWWIGFTRAFGSFHVRTFTTNAEALVLRKKLQFSSTLTSHHLASYSAGKGTSCWKILWSFTITPVVSKRLSLTNHQTWIPADM